MIYLVNRTLNTRDLEDHAETACIAAYSNPEESLRHQSLAMDWKYQHRSEKINSSPSPYDRMFQDLGYWDQDIVYWTQVIPFDKQLKEEPDDYYTYATYHFA